MGGGWDGGVGDDGLGWRGSGVGEVWKRRPVGGEKGRAHYALIAIRADCGLIANAIACCT